MLHCHSRYFQRGLRAFDGPTAIGGFWRLPCLDVIHMVDAIHLAFSIVMPKKIEKYIPI